MVVAEQAAAAPAGNEAIGDLLRHRKRALRAVQASAKLRTRGEGLSTWSPRAALYKKRRALRQELAGASAPASTERKADASREEADQPAIDDAGDQAENAEQKRTRGRWFSGLLDSPSASATTSTAPPSDASDSPKVRRTIHGVLQSPGEVHLSDAAKKARRQLTRIRDLTSDGCDPSTDDPVFCGKTAASSRAALFSTDMDGVPDGAIMCADLGQTLQHQRNPAATQPRTEHEIAADVAASAVSKMFTSAISHALATAQKQEN
jgi:hypothetical protein